MSDPAATERTIRVLLVDDHVIVREGLRALLSAEHDITVVGEAATGLEACDRALQLQPDVVVMDVSMPDCNGAEATQRIKAQQPHVKVMALTVYEDPTYVQELLKAGASGYVLKRCAAKELIQSIRTVASGGVHLALSDADKVLERYVNKPATSRDAMPGTELSERESEVLRLIAWGHTNKEIANILNISIKTIDTYKSRLMEKLDLHSRVDIVRYAVRMGLMQDRKVS